MDRSELESEALLLLVIAYREHSEQRSPFRYYLRLRILWGLADYRRSNYGRGACWRHYVQLSENLEVPASEATLHAAVQISQAIKRIRYKGKQANRARLIRVLELYYLEGHTTGDIGKLWGLNSSRAVQLLRAANSAFADQLLLYREVVGPTGLEPVTVGL